jgi:hypothetical protein
MQINNVSGTGKGQTQTCHDKVHATPDIIKKKQEGLEKNEAVIKSLVRNRRR